MSYKLIKQTLVRGFASGQIPSSIATCAVFHTAAGEWHII